MTGDMRSRYVPVSSYRLQFGPHLRFEDAQRLVPYLEAMGITDCYTSPLLKSSTGSEHGYDICDHHALNEVLGSTDAFDAFACDLRQRGMGLILDFVPNHMGLDPSANRWWHDVLQHGQASPYADYFDIDWNPVTPELKGRVLLPVLQDSYGEVLHRGELRLAFGEGEFFIQYWDRRFPIEPISSLAILRLVTRASHAHRQDPEWGELLGAVAMVESLPAASAREPAQREIRQQTTGAARKRLADATARSPHIRALVERTVARFNGTPGQAATFDRLHDLLDRQPYRLAHWKTAFDEINYRRFFDINDLGALRMEEPRVFEAAHGLVLRLIAERKVTGLRIDHPDGLLEPAAYLTRLQCAAARALPESREGEPQEPFYVVVEKILGRGELLPENWPVAGTTGYGFLNNVGGVFIDEKNEDAFRSSYARMTGRRESFAEVVYRSKRLVMGSSMASELAVLARALKGIAGSDRTTRDFTLTALRKTIVEVVAALPVYRTYVSSAGVSASDRETIDGAIDRARRSNPVIASSIFLFVRNVLLAQGDEQDEHVQARRRFAARFQQFSASVHAKGLEDTSFYRYTALLSLNEVGGDPSHFGTAIEEFHSANRVRLERWHTELTATATHDTKRGEDARARLNVLSEMPAAWRRAVTRWRKINELRRTVVDRELAPDANDEHLFYESLLGTWPAEPLDAPIPSEAPPALVARLRAYMHKAIKEAKTHTSWVTQNNAYEDAVARFVETTLGGPSAQGFLAAFVPFARQVALGGMVNSLGQLVLKLAAPGVPDFYQGTETWQLDLTDPDNRRPVDFAQRQALLDELMPWIVLAESRDREPRAACPCPDELDTYVRDLVASWPDARIKMFVMACGLRLRRKYQALFIDGTYEPLRVDGLRAGHVIAFARCRGEDMVVAVVPRLMNRGLMDVSQLAEPKTWEGTEIVLPPHASAASVRHVFTGMWFSARGEEGRLSVAELFRSCPAALLLAHIRGHREG